jgi:DNA-binding NarL/FixJ family response regulator
LDYHPAKELVGMTTEMIKVICADDTDIAVEGMHRLLEYEPGILVVDRVTHLEDVARTAEEQKADVILLDLKWGANFSAGYEAIREIRSVSPQTQILAITVYNELGVQARREGADDVVGKDIGGPELVAKVRKMAEGNPWRIGRRLMSELGQVPVGDLHAASRHEEIVLELLRFCLEPELSNWRTQVPTYSGAERADIVCSNFSQRPFWSSVRQQHDAQQIVFQLKNTDTLRKEHMDQLVDSLGEPRGRLGFLVARAVASAAFHRTTYLPFDRLKLVILSLSDEDLKLMVDARVCGNDPSDVIIRHYEGFVNRRFF